MNYLKNLNNNKSNIFICVGMPLTGKTTYANNIKNNLHDTIVINKFDIYEKYISYKKQLTTEDFNFFENIKYSILNTAIKFNKNIVIDDCNLYPKKLEFLINNIFLNINKDIYDVYIIDFTDIDYDIIFSKNKELYKYNVLTIPMLYSNIDEIKTTIENIKSSYNIKILKYEYE